MISTAKLGGPLVKPLHRQPSQKEQIGERLHAAATTVSPREIARQVIDSFGARMEGNVAQKARDKAEAERVIDTDGIRDARQAARAAHEARLEAQVTRVERESANHHAAGDRSQRADAVRERKLEKSRERTAHLDDAAEKAVERAAEDRRRNAAIQIERAAEAKRQRAAVSTEPPDRARPDDTPITDNRPTDARIGADRAAEARRREAQAAQQFAAQVAQVRAAEARRDQMERSQLDTTM